MKARIAPLRDKFSYANITATLALFVALGGTSYAAIAIPRNSVGHKQLRANAVRSSDIRNGSVRLKDVASATRTALRGQQGPQGPPGTPATALFATVNSGGGVVTGTLSGGQHNGGTNVYDLRAPRDVSQCAYSATLGAVQNGPVLEEPPAGRATVASVASPIGPTIRVKTFDAAGNPAPLPFHVIVAC